MNKELVFRKVKAKLEYKEFLAILDQEGFNKDAGLKEWIAGAALAMTALLGNPSNAFAEAKDVDNYLNKVKKEWEKKDPKKKEFAVKNIYKPGQGKSGRGNFLIDIGPYQLKGIYWSAGKTNNSQLKLLTERGADQKELKEWKPLVNKIYKRFNEALDKGMYDDSADKAWEEYQKSMGF